MSSGLALGQGPPIRTDTPVTTGLEGSAIRSFLRVVRKSGLIRGGDPQVDPAGRSLRVSVIPVAYPFYIDPDNTDWVTTVVVPRVEKRLSASGRVLRSSGLGDVSLLTKYRISKEDDRFRTTQWSIVTGVKFPTGETDARDPTGAFLPAGLQVGSGSYDVPARLVFGRVEDRLGLYASAGWTFRGEGAREFEAGDSFDYGLAIGYRLLPGVYREYPAESQWNVYLELNGSAANRSRQVDQEIGNSGGHSLSLSPGIQLIKGTSLLLEASYEIPLVSDLNGTQIRPDTGFSLGLRYLF